jgi:uncharacterized protein YlxP (DUF503 family)
MVIGVCTIELHIPGNHSLKGKRGILKPILARLRREFNVSAAEVGENDAWQSSSLGLAAVSNEAGYVQGLLEKAVHWLATQHPEVQIVDWQIEVLG